MIFLFDWNSFVYSLIAEHEASMFNEVPTTVMAAATMELRKMNAIVWRSVWKWVESPTLPSLMPMKNVKSKIVVTLWQWQLTKTKRMWMLCVRRRGLRETAKYIRAHFITLSITNPLRYSPVDISIRWNRWIAWKSSRNKHLRMSRASSSSHSIPSTSQQNDKPIDHFHSLHPNQFIWEGHRYRFTTPNATLPFNHDWMNQIKI